MFSLKCYLSSCPAPPLCSSASLPLWLWSCDELAAHSSQRGLKRMNHMRNYRIIVINCAVIGWCLHLVWRAAARPHSSSSPRGVWFSDSRCQPRVCQTSQTGHWGSSPTPQDHSESRELKICQILEVTIIITFDSWLMIIKWGVRTHHRRSEPCQVHN